MYSLLWEAHLHLSRLPTTAASFPFPHPHSRWPRDSSSKAPKQGTRGCWVGDSVLGLLWISLPFVSFQGLRQKCMLQSPKNDCKQPTEPTPTPGKRLSPAFQKVHLGGLTPSWFLSSQIKSAHPWTSSGRNHRYQWPHACEIQAHRVHVYRQKSPSLVLGVVRQKGRKRYLLQSLMAWVYFPESSLREGTMNSTKLYIYTLLPYCTVTYIYTLTQIYMWVNVYVDIYIFSFLS